MKRTELIAGIAVLALLLFPAGLLAQQGGKINFGNLSVIPGIELQGVYDDNIFKGNGKEYAGNPARTQQEKKESDCITHLKPSLFLNYNMQERGYVRAGYQGDFAFYNKTRDNNWKNQQGLLDANYTAPGGLILGVNNIFTNAEDPYGNAEQVGIGRVTKRWTNELKTKLGYNIMSNLRALVYYNNGKQQYRDLLDFSQDYTENEYGVGVESRFLPKTWGFLRFHHGRREYDTLAGGLTRDRASDFKWNRVSTGLTWDADAKLSGEFNVGYQWLTYDNEFADVARTQRREDKNTWTAATSINYLATATTTLNMNIVRAVRNTAGDTNEQFTDTGIGFNVQQQLLAKLMLTGGLTYSRNEYNLPVGNPRTDNNYLANLGLNYAIQEWMGVGVGYTYNRKDSNDEFQEFVDNQFMVSLKIVY
jgi:hypothetical protein